MNELIKYKGIDGFNRPIFKSTTTRNHFGSTDKLFDHGAPEAEVLATVTERDLTFFGLTFGCEPMGTPADFIKIIHD